MSLLTKSHEQVAKTLEKMNKEAKDIVVDLLKTTWYMRGGITFSEGMALSHEARVAINDIIKENLETTKKTGLNFF